MKTERFIVKWRHQMEGRERGTSCLLTDHRGKLVSVGEARCYIKDPFNKEIGRKVSLTKCLEDTTVSREDKREIWETYRNMTKKPKW